MSDDCAAFCQEGVWGACQLCRFGFYGFSLKGGPDDATLSGDAEYRPLVVAISGSPTAADDYVDSNNPENTPRNVLNVLRSQH